MINHKYLKPKFRNKHHEKIWRKLLEIDHTIHIWPHYRKKFDQIMQDFIKLIDEYKSEAKLKKGE